MPEKNAFFSRNSAPHVAGVLDYEFNGWVLARQIEGALTESFRGWVLVPAKGFLGYVAAVHREGLNTESHPAMRSASGRG